MDTNNKKRRRNFVKVGKYVYLKLGEKIVSGIIQDVEINKIAQLDSDLSTLVQVRLLSDNNNVILKIPSSFIFDKIEKPDRINFKRLNKCYKCNNGIPSSNCENCLKIVNETTVPYLIEKLRGSNEESPKWIYHVESTDQNLFDINCTTDINDNCFSNVTFLRLKETSYPNQIAVGMVECVITLSYMRYDEPPYYQMFIDYQSDEKTGKSLKKYLQFVKIKINDSIEFPSNHLNSLQLSQLLTFFIDKLGFVAICKDFYEKDYKQIVKKLIECCKSKKLVFLKFDEPQ